MFRPTLLFCISLLPFLELPAGAAAELQAGVAVVDITPPVPWRMSGYFYERVSTGIKDPLHAKAVVFKQGDESCALVFCDLVGVPLAASGPAREAASVKTGIPAESIAIMATHSHTGPLFYGAMRDLFHDRAVKRVGNDPNEPIDYTADLVEKLAAAIAKAANDAKPVQLAAGFGIENRLAFNRRYYMRDGSVRFNPGLLNPDIVRPAGPTDPQVGIITLKPAGAAHPEAAIVEFAMHLDTTGGTEYSADYPRFMEQRLRESYGKDFVALFGAGTCGDINHIDVKSKEVRKPEQIGPMLAETVDQAINSPAVSPIKKPDLAVLHAEIEAPLQSYSPGEVSRARQRMEVIGTRALSFLEEVEAYKITSLQAFRGSAYPLEVQAFRLSRDVAIVALPSEVFV
jgi:hypothetical protein